MPPRYAYWTVIVDDQATAFRAGALDDLMPTFNRIKEKQPTAKLMWFQNGKLWPSRLDAREAMAMRGDRGRDRDPRQRSSGDGTRPEWKPTRTSGQGAPVSNRDSRPAWKPKSGDRGAPAFRPSDSREKPEWKPRSAAGPGPKMPGRDHGARPEWKPKSSTGVVSSLRREDSRERPEWKPKSSASLKAQAPGPAESKRKWVPKAEYKKATGTEAKRDQAWRPGGEHKDPRQKYKDAKKAKWTRFKQAIRTRAGKKRDS